MPVERVEKEILERKMIMGREKLFGQRSRMREIER